MSHTPIFVAGSGRSGTTWIGDTLASAAGACSIFEPLAPWALPRPGAPFVTGEEALHSPGLYLPPDAEFPEWRTFWRGVLTGRRSSSWTRQDWRYVPHTAKRWSLTMRAAYCTAAVRYKLRAHSARRFLVKGIYSNLSLPWLDSQLDLQVLLVLRHPCAVVASRVRLGWPDSLDGIFRQPLLMEGWLSPYQDVLRMASTPIERMAVLWCVENLVPLRSWRPRWLYISYEELISNPDEGFARLCDTLALPHLAAAKRTAEQLCSTPGPQAGKPSHWHSSLSPADGERVLHICERFGLDFYDREPGLIRNPVGSVGRNAPSSETTIGRVGWAGEPAAISTAQTPHPGYRH